MRSSLRGGRRSLRIIAAYLLCGMLSAALCHADGIGILIAPAQPQISEAEARDVEALVDALLAHDMRVSVLHPLSPLVAAARISLPNIAADDDWTPLRPVLDTIAVQLRLDHVLLTAMRPAEGELRIEGLLVTRGGAGTRISGEDAEAMALRLVWAVAEQGPPRDLADEAVAIGREPLPPPVRDEPDPALDVDERPAVPTADERPADEPVAAPVVVEEEPVHEEPAVDVPQVQEMSEVDIERTVREADAPLGPAEEAYESGRLDVAAALLDEYVRVHGPSGSADLLRARLSLARLQHDEARQYLERAVALDPDLVEARVWLARLLAEQGLWQKSVEHYERSLESDPASLEALLGLARVYRDHGHRRRAITLLQDAGDLGRSDPSLLLMLGDLHTAEGNVELAEMAYLRTAAAANGETRAAALERLGDLYVELRRHRDALSCYLEAAELNPSRTSMAQRRYREVMSAADGAVHESLTSGWSVFEDYAHHGTGHREMVYRHLSALHDQLDEAMRFADGIKPPTQLQGDHARRQLAYSLAVEAAVSAVSYLDLGEESMLERAGSRHREALDEFQSLQRDSRG